MGCAPSSEQDYHREPLIESDMTSSSSASLRSLALDSQFGRQSADGSTHSLSNRSVGGVEESRLWWRETDMADLLRRNPDKPWWDLADRMVPAKPTIVKPHLNLIPLVTIVSFPVTLAITFSIYSLMTKSDININRSNIPRYEHIDPEQPQKRRGWKMVRLFVSSTFKDMHSEREYLVKRIFPQLRQWCEQRRLRLVECDLRWGVPKDASTQQTLDACLSEIDRCYEENEHPYFLALISERYGWVPESEQVPPAIKHRYKWIPGMSVTTLEVMTGGYWDRNPNALYMLRDPTYLKALDNSKLLDFYTESDQQSKRSLKVLKERLRTLAEKNTNGLRNVSQYKCDVDRLTEKRAELSGLEAFGDEVIAHFQTAMEHQYPDTALEKELTQEEIQAEQHEAFMTQRSAVLLGRDKVIKVVLKYIRDVPSTVSVPLVLLGFPGSGKSAVIAKLARMLSGNEKNKVLYHFVGATPGSTDLSTLLTRIWRSLMSAEDKPPADDGELRYSLQAVLKNGSETLQAGSTLTLLIDALNQLDDDDAEEKILDWLPRVLPSNVRIVVSTLEGPCLDALRKSETPLPEVIVAPLGEDIRRDIVVTYLSEYNKTLDDDQLQILVRKQDAGRPLYLTVASEELRVFGYFRKLTQKIEDLPQDLTSLILQVLDRIISENGGELVVATLCLIECARHGLLETELLTLLLGFSNMDEPPDSRLPMAEWAIVYLGLRPFLRPSGGSGEGRLDFYHRTISKAVRTKHLTPSEKRRWHQLLVDYFTTGPDLDRRAEELPYQLVQLGDVRLLQRALVENSTFVRLYTPAMKQTLLRYWQQAGGYQAATEHTKLALRDHIKSLSAEEALQIQTKTLNFFTDIGQYADAEQLLTTVLERTTEVFGAISKQMCEPLFAAVILYYQQGIKVVYSSDPVYGRCSAIGRKYAATCALVHKRHYAPDDLHLGRVLTKCGYFIQNHLDEAKRICKGRSEQDYAEILYNLGEKSQYEEIHIPVGIFEESLKLCLSHFGHYHLSTARCYQLYGQVYWNQEVSMDICLEKYKQELEILQTLLGAHHPITVRSREDVIIILQTLKRNSEANELQLQQPDN